uniref:Ribosomal protein L10e/L16 domain-containing protein n=1 Tax=Sus scrofa TaxID=9823 RepID=A0A8D1A3J0_PIG
MAPLKLCTFSCFCFISRRTNPAQHESFTFTSVKQINSRALICYFGLIECIKDLHSKHHRECLEPVKSTYYVNKSESKEQFQTGMCDAFGKPQGTVARVHICQVIASIYSKLQNKEHVIEALRRAKFKLPGRQKIHISKKWGFTKFNADEFENMVAEKRLIPDGCGRALHS